ncbi:MAG: hypothetical protein LIP23_09205 [Planctomycetes bacterium]|nr:hypothetical protein [Planctomycetota bacterium]
MIESLPPRPRCLRRVTPELIMTLGQRIRREHVRELRQFGWADPVDAALASYHASLESWCCVAAESGAAVFVMGVAAAAPATGGATVWMLGTEEMDVFPLAVAKAGRWGIGRAFALSHALYLEQLVPRWYGTGLRFVHWLGFTPVIGWRGDSVAVRLNREDWLAGENGKGKKKGKRWER